MGLPTTSAAQSLTEKDSKELLQDIKKLEDFKGRIRLLILSDLAEKEISGELERGIKYARDAVKAGTRMPGLGNASEHLKIVVSQIKGYSKSLQEHRDGILKECPAAESICKRLEQFAKVGR